METPSRTGIIVYITLADFHGQLQQDREQALARQRDVGAQVRQNAEHCSGRLLASRGPTFLVFFEEAERALRCALAIRGGVRAPLRISLCRGEVILSEEDAYGEGIGRAAHLDTLAVAESILVEGALRPALRRAGFQLQVLGHFRFPHEARPVEVLAVTGPGLVVPEVRSPASWITPAPGNAPADSGGDISGTLGELWQRSIPQLLAGYLLAAWTVLQFTDWALHRYQISDTWTDLLLVLFATMLPSALLYFFHRERLNEGRWKRSEQWFVLLNTILTLGLIVSLFHDSEFGPIPGQTALAHAAEPAPAAAVVRPELVERVLIYPFQPPAGDSLEPWPAPAISMLLDVDLDQSGYVYSLYTPEDRYCCFDPEAMPQPLSQRFQAAADMGCSYVVTGQYDRQNELLRATLRLYRVQDGQLVMTETFTGSDIFAMVDLMSVQIKAGLGLSQQQVRQFPDLPVSSMMTESAEALRHFTLGAFFDKLDWYVHLEQAEAIDSTFAYASFVRARELKNLRPEEARQVTLRVLRHLNRLSGLLAITTRADCFLLLDEPERAERFLRNQLEAAPDRRTLLYKLAEVQGYLGQYDEVVTTYEQLAREFPEDELARSMLGSYYLNAMQVDKGIQWVTQLVKETPSFWRNYLVLAELYSVKGDYDQAADLYQKAIDLHPDPEHERWMLRFLDYLAFARNNPLPSGLLEQYAGPYVSGPARGNTSRILRRGNRLLFHFLYGGRLMGYPVSSSSFINFDGTLEATFLTDSTGQAYAFRQRYMDQPYVYYFWRQDTTLQHVDELISQRQFPRALQQCRQAMIRFPHHLYLRRYEQALRYQTDPATAAKRAGFPGYAGTYRQRGSDARLSLHYENGQLYVSLGKSLPLQLLPLDADNFLVPTIFSDQLRFQRKNGRIDGITLMHYNFETGALTPAQQFEYLERVSGLDGDLSRQAAEDK